MHVSTSRLRWWMHPRVKCQCVWMWREIERNWRSSSRGRGSGSGSGSGRWESWWCCCRSILAVHSPSQVCHFHLRQVTAPFPFLHHSNYNFNTQTLLLHPQNPYTYIFRNIIKWYKHLCLESNKNKHVSSYLIVWNKFRIQSIAQNRMFWCYWYSFECRVRNKVWDGVYSL